MEDLQFTFLSLVKVWLFIGQKTNIKSILHVSSEGEAKVP